MRYTTAIVVVAALVGVGGAYVSVTSASAAHRSEKRAAAHAETAEASASAAVVAGQANLEMLGRAGQFLDQILGLSHQAKDAARDAASDARAARRSRDEALLLKRQAEWIARNAASAPPPTGSVPPSPKPAPATPPPVRTDAIARRLGVSPDALRQLPAGEVSYTQLAQVFGVPVSRIEAAAREEAAR